MKSLRTKQPKSREYYRQIEVCEIDIGDKLAIGMYAPRRGENEDEQPLYMYARYGIKTFLPNNDE